MDYQHVAETLASRTAELLQTTVAVTDERDIIVAGSDARAVGLPARLAGDFLQAEYVRVPLRLNANGGEVIVARPPEGESLSPRLARVIVDLVVSQTVVVNRLPNGNAIKNKFIHDVLHGLVADEATILREAKVLGLDLVPPRAVILIDAADYILGPAADRERGAGGRRVERQAHLLVGSIVSFFKLPNDTICAHLGDGEVAVLKASNTRNLAAWADSDEGRDGGTSSWANLDALKRASEALLARLRADTGAAISVGIGRHHPGLRGLARSYGDARAALSLGRCLRGPNGVHCLDRLGVAAFVGLNDEHTKAELAQHLLSPLDHEPELLETLEAFFAENCGPSPTASRLAIHRNTLGYRLDKIASLTGLDPRRFDEALQIRLALVLRALHGGHGTNDRPA
jgi:carbohydrate diacid regulator